MTGTLGVFTRPESEVEAQLEHIGYMWGFGIGGGGRSGHDGVDNAKGGAFSGLDGGSSMP